MLIALIKLWLRHRKLRKSMNETKQIITDQVLKRAGLTRKDKVW